MKNLFSLLICITCYFPLSFAIEIRSTHYTYSDGLPNNSVRSFLQDRQGFLWLATLNGLSRYDGSGFSNFYPAKADDSPSLSNHNLNHISEDRYGFLWIQSAPHGFSCYDPHKESFVDFSGQNKHTLHYNGILFSNQNRTWLWGKQHALSVQYSPETGFSSTLHSLPTRKNEKINIRFVYEDKDSRIWICTNRGIYLHTESGFVCISDSVVCFQILEINRQQYFFGLDNKLYHYDDYQRTLIPLLDICNESATTTGAFIHKEQLVLMTSKNCMIYNPADGIAKTDIDFFGERIINGHVQKDNMGNIWIRNRSGKIHYLNTTTSQIKSFVLMDSDQVKFIDHERYHIIHDSRGLIWISTYGNGLFCYNEKEDQLTHYSANPDKTSHLTSNYILKIYEDRSGALWISCEYAGIVRLAITGNKTKRLFPVDTKLADRSNTIRMIKKTERGDILVSTRQGGLFRYDYSQKLIPVPLSQRQNCYDYEIDHEGNEWIGSKGNGLLVNGIRYMQNPNDPEALSNNNIYVLQPDRRGRMWIGTFGGGLNCAFKKTDGRWGFRRFFYNDRTQRFIRTMCCDNNGNLWIGGNNGLLLFNPDSLLSDKSAFRHYTTETGTLLSDEIRCITRDENDIIWAGTSGGGFIKIDNRSESATFVHYNTTHGLINNVVQSIVSDNDHNIWLATEYGLSKFYPSQEKFESYLLCNDILGNTFNENSGCIDSLGNLLLGTNSGCIVFDPKRITHESHMSNLNFTDLYINGVRVLPDSYDSPLVEALCFTSVLHLKHNQNAFSINFNSFDFNHLNPLKYVYKLEGYDNDWSIPSESNMLTYKNLEPGEYTLRVKAVPNISESDSQERTLRIIVSPPPYLRGWAWTCYLILLIIIVVLSFRITRKFIAMRHRIILDNELNEYKLTFFTNISHEFRTPLTLILNSLEKIREYAPTTKELSLPLASLQKNTDRLMLLIDQLLEFRKLNKNKLTLQVQHINIVTYMRDIYSNFLDKAEIRNCTYRFTSEKEEIMLYADTDKFEKIFYNLISNAFKYSPKGAAIEVELQEDAINDILLIRIKDTGFGIETSRRGTLFQRFAGSNYKPDSTGIGLHLTHELVSLHHGRISYHEGENKVGSVFEVIFPLNGSCYTPDERISLPFHTNRTLSAAEEKRPEETTLPLPHIPAINKQKILIIDDEDDIRCLLEREIGRYFQVVSAENGEAGLKLAMDTEPDLIICDILMPLMNGYEVCRKVKNNYVLCHIPVILLTALSSEEDQKSGYESSADSYLTKPFKVNLLLTRIIQLLEQRNKLREKFSQEISTDIIKTKKDEKDFVVKMNEILEEKLLLQAFSIDDLATEMRLSRNNFYKLTKESTGFAPVEYVRVVRMKKAAHLLVSTDLTISEIAYKVGFNDPYYFSKCFKGQYGKAPSVFQKEQREAMPCRHEVTD